MRQENLNQNRKNYWLTVFIRHPTTCTFLHDDRINFNIHKDVLWDLDVNPTSETWFSNKYIEDENLKKYTKRDYNLQVMKWHMILDNT